IGISAYMNIIITPIVNSYTCISADKHIGKLRSRFRIYHASSRVVDDAYIGNNSTTAHIIQSCTQTGQHIVSEDKVAKRWRCPEIINSCTLQTGVQSVHYGKSVQHGGAVQLILFGIFVPHNRSYVLSVQDRTVRVGSVWHYTVVRQIGYTVCRVETTVDFYVVFHNEAVVAYVVVA